MSNYLEHLPSSEAVVRQLDQARQVLKPGGRLIVLQPNIRFVGGAYWDFLDHKVAAHGPQPGARRPRSSGFQVERMIPRFLPVHHQEPAAAAPAGWCAPTSASPPAWRLMGKQALMVARRPQT